MTAGRGAFFFIVGSCFRLAGMINIPRWVEIHHPYNGHAMGTRGYVRSRVTTRARV